MNSDTGGILGVFGFIVSMAGVIYTAINHKKIRCRCCGKDLDMSVDVDTTEEIKKTVKEEAAVAASAAAQEQVDTEEDNKEDDEEDDDDESVAAAAVAVAAAAVAAAAAKAKTRLNEVTAIRVMSAQRSRSTSNDAYPDSLEPSRKKISKGKIVPIVDA